MNTEHDCQKILRVFYESPDRFYRPSISEYFSTVLKDDPKMLNYVLDNSNVYLPRYIKLLKDDEQYIVEKALMGSINISSVPRGSDVLLKMFLDTETSIGIIKTLWSHVLNTETSKIATLATALMANLTRKESSINDILPYLPSLDKISEEISFQLMNESNAPEKRQYLSHVLLNLTTLSQVRKHLLNPEESLLWLITPLLNENDRFDGRCLWGIIKNLSFDTDDHCNLLEEYRVLGKLLFVLIGNEEYSEEEADKLPIEVRYMMPNKTRNDDVLIRKTILETLYQLGATTYGRKFMRSRNVYLILRDYHKWENDDECLSLCEDVVNLLIRTEEEIGADNIRLIETTE